MTQLAVTVPMDLGDFIQASIASGDFAGPNELATRARAAFRNAINKANTRCQNDKNCKSITVQVICSTIRPPDGFTVTERLGNEAKEICGKTESVDCCKVRGEK